MCKRGFTVGGCSSGNLIGLGPGLIDASLRVLLSGSKPLGRGLFGGALGLGELDCCRLLRIMLGLLGDATGLDTCLLDSLGSKALGFGCGRGNTLIGFLLGLGDLGCGGLTFTSDFDRHAIGFGLCSSNAFFGDQLCSLQPLCCLFTTCCPIGFELRSGGGTFTCGLLHEPGRFGTSCGDAVLGGGAGGGELLGKGRTSRGGLMGNIRCRRAQ